MKDVLATIVFACLVFFVVASVVFTAQASYVLITKLFASQGMFKGYEGVAALGPTALFLMAVFRHVVFNEHHV